ncbi:MAG: GEVED domain-containing protein, partial [Bacteroidota bacterium]
MNNHTFTKQLFLLASALSLAGAVALPLAAQTPTATENSLATLSADERGLVIYETKTLATSDCESADGSLYFEVNSTDRTNYLLQAEFDGEVQTFTSGQATPGLYTFSGLAAGSYSEIRLKDQATGQTLYYDSGDYEVLSPCTSAGPGVTGTLDPRGEDIFGGVVVAASQEELNEEAAQQRTVASGPLYDRTPLAPASASEFSTLVNASDIPGFDLVTVPGLNFGFYGGHHLFYGTDKYLELSWMTEGAPAYLNAWVDWNDNNSFEASERIIANFQVGTNRESGSTTFAIQAPTDFVLGNKEAYFSLTNETLTQPNNTELSISTNVELVEGAPNSAASVYPSLEPGEIIESGTFIRGESRSTCGTGTFTEFNCEGEQLTVDRANLTPDSYIYFDDDYLACGLAYVDNSCNIQTVERAYCADFNLTAPTPGAGYPYGTAIYTKTFGAVNAGYDELVAERINWVLCNGDNTTNNGRVEINRAIWYLTGTYATCGTLCTNAIAAVPSVQGGIENQMIVYIPNNSSLQPFIEGFCTSNCVPDVVFDNTGDCPVTVYRVNGGTETNLATLNEGQSYTSSSFVGTQYVVRLDYDDSVVENYTTSSDCMDQHVNVSSDMCVMDCPNNEVANAGFESGNSGWGFAGNASVTSGIVNSGQKSGVMEDPNTSISRSFTFAGNMMFSFSTMARTDGDAGSYFIGVDFLNSSGVEVDDISLIIDNDTHKFNQYLITGVTPNQTASVRVWFYRDQHTNGNMWIDDICFQETGDVVDGGDPPSDFSFGCEDGTFVEIYASSVDCNGSPQTLTNIPNSNEVYQVVAEVVFKGGANQGSSIALQASDGNSYVAERVTVSGNSPNVRVYRGLIPLGVDWVSYTVDNACTNNSNNNNGLQSLVTYAFRNTTVKRSSTGTFTGVSGYNNIQTFSIPVPTDNVSRDMVITVPLSEMTTDGRYLTLNAKIGGVLVGTETIFGPSSGCCVELVQIPLSDVAGSVSQIDFEIDTRNDQLPGSPTLNGQSYVLSGTVYADVICPTIGNDYGDAPDSYGDICYIVSNTGAGLTQTILGDLVDAESGSQHTANAQGDDNNGVDDEDGVIFSGGTTLTAGETKEITISWSSNDQEGHIFGWIDWDGNGTFDSDEVVIDNFIVGSSVNRVSGSRAFYVEVPDDVICGTSYARFTINSDVSEAGPTGNFCATTSQFDDGEVEDYMVTLAGQTDLVCEYNIDNSGFVTDDCHVDICVGQQLTLSINPNEANTTWAGPNGFTATGNNLNLGAVTAAQAGDYTATVNFASGCVGTTTISVSVEEVPDVTISTSPANCGAANGSITLSFPNDPNQTHLEFSLDGGVSYLPAVADNAGTVTYQRVPGTYTVFARWGDNDCPIEVGDAVITENDGPLVGAYCGDVQTSKTISNTVADCPNVENDPHAVYADALFPNDLDYSQSNSRYWTVVGANSFEEFANGSAILQLTVRNAQNTNLRMRFDVLLTGRTQSPPPMSPKTDLCVNTVGQDWYYYPSFSGTVTGLNGLAGMELSVQGSGPALQVGTGANLKENNAFGFASWMQYAVLSQANSGVQAAAGAQFDFNLVLSSDELPKFDGDDQCGPICVGESVTINAEAFGGSGVLSYSWSNGGSGTSIQVTPNTTTTYTVTVEDENGCTSTDEVTVEVNEAAWDNVSLGSDVTNCAGDCDGSIVVDPAFSVTGEFRVEYTFNGSLVQVPGTFSTPDPITIDHLCAGTYTNITIIGVHTDCEAIWPEDIIITEPNPPTAHINGPNSECSGVGVNFIANAQNGANYSWDFGDFATPATATGIGDHLVTYNLPANQLGNVVVTVTLTVTRDGCSDTTTKSFTIKDLPEATASGVNPTCGEDNGSITFTFPDNPDRTGIEFSTNGAAGPFQNSNDNTGTYTISNLGAGTYDLYARWGDDSCPIDLPNVTLTDQNGPSITVNGVDPACDESNGSATVNISGGTAPFTIAWSNDGTTATITGLSNGTYGVTVTDINGCQATGSVTLDGIENLTDGGEIAADQQGCAPSFDPVTFTSITLPSGGTTSAAIEYQWFQTTGDCTPPTTQDQGDWVEIPGANSATYDAGPVTETTCFIRCSRRAGCELYLGESNVVTVTVSPTPVVSVNNDEICAGEDAILTATVSSGTGPFEYEWSNGATTASITVSPGTTTGYSVMVTDANDCTGSASGTVTVNPNPVVSVGGANICVGENATLTTVVMSGTGPFSYEWNTGATTASITVSPGSTANYSVTVTDDKGCVGFDDATVTVRPLPTAQINGPSSTCAEEAVTFTATDAGPLVDYSWDFGDFASPATAMGANPGPVTYTLPAGQNGNSSATVTLTVTQNGCMNETTLNIQILDLPEIADVSSTNPTCGADNGTITISFVDNPDRSNIAFSTNGIAGPYTSVPDNAGSYTFSDLDAGIYDLYVRWGNEDCPIDLEDVTISDENAPTVVASDDESICVGGTVNLTAMASGGTGTITY